MTPRLSLSLTACALALLLRPAPAEATPITFSGSSTTGLVVVALDVASLTSVTFTWNSGYDNATFSLFDSAGLHIVSANDGATADPVLTWALGPGQYFLLATYYATAWNYLIVSGATPGTTDGVNIGTFLFGGSGTGAGALFAIDTDPFRIDPYRWDFDADPIIDKITPTSVTGPFTFVPTSVPEPATLALVGIGLAGLAFARHKAQRPERSRLRPTQ